MSIALPLLVSLVAATGPATPAPAGEIARAAEQQAMLWKYTARCALRGDQELEMPAAADGSTRKFRGAFGLAPEWRDGRCDGTCQEKVSACLAALTNPTGDHVPVSLLSAAPSLLPLMSASDSDAAYPYQEGAFFGNVFAGEAFVCRGTDVEKGAQLKRFCALAPALCSGIATFADAGSCADRCEMSCTRIGDGTTRCAAVACRDPKGRLWSHPVTTYLRARIDAVNADVVSGARTTETALGSFGDHARALFRHVDFGRAPGAVHHLVAKIQAPKGRGEIQLWLTEGKRLAVLPVLATGSAGADVTVPLDARALSGPHDIELRFESLAPDAHLIDFELR